MRFKEIERIVHHEPFVPFRVVLQDGEEIVVRRPRKALVSGPELAVVGICRRNGGAAQEKLRIVPVKNVVSLEVLSTVDR